jgi:tetratricopeptide (TPR) repeat protein
MRRPLRVADAAIIAGAVALVVALPALANGFTYDDVWLVQRHPVVQAPGNLAHLLTATYWPATGGEGSLWRPLTLAGFAAQWAVGGGSPLPFHAVTILLGAAAAALVAVVGGALFGPVVALVAGVLFAVHPVHVEVTATVVGQADLLAAIAYLVALLGAWNASDGSRNDRRWWWVALAAAAALVGLGAKENVITLPVALPLVWWWRAQRDGRRLRDVARSEAPVLLAVVAVSGAYLLARHAILGNVEDAGGVATGLDPHSAVRRAVVMLPLSLRWLELLFAPIRLSAVYSPRYVIPHPVFGTSHAIALTVWAALTIMVWEARRRAPAVALGAALFAVTIAIVSNVPVPLEVLLAERLLYLPSAGWALAMGGLAAMWHADARHRSTVTILVAGVALAFGVRAVGRAPVWRSNATLFAQMLREAPQSFQTHWALGSEALARGDSATVEKEWREAIRLNPDHPQPLEDLGRLYAASGRWAPAISLLDRVLQLDSTRLGTALLLASALSHVGRTAEALSVLDVMQRRQDGGAALRTLRADVLLRAGDPTAALAAVREALTRDSTPWRLWVYATDVAREAGACAVADSLAAEARRRGGAPAAEALDRAGSGTANRKGSCN